MSQSKIMMGIGMPISQRSMPTTEPFLYLHHSNRDNNVRRSCEVPSSSDSKGARRQQSLWFCIVKPRFFARHRAKTVGGRTITTPCCPYQPPS